MATTFTTLLKEELERQTAPPKGGGLYHDPFAAPQDFEAADQWVVNLHGPFQDLARSIAEAGQPEKLKVVAGAWGSGKSLLLGLLHHTARRAKAATGDLASAMKLLEFNEETGSNLEDQVLAWHNAAEEAKLQYLLLDDVVWPQLVSGRLNQVHQLLSAHKTSIVFAVDFIGLHDLYSVQGMRNRLEVVRIAPYRERDMLDLWSTRFGNLSVTEAELQRLVDHCLGNPRLLLLLGNLLSQQAKERHDTTISHRLLSSVLQKHGYDAGRKLREGMPSSPDGGVEEASRIKILLRVSQRSTGRDEKPGGITATELSRDYGLERSLCSYHLSQLEKDGYVFKHRSGASVNYAAWPAVRVALENFILMAYD